MWGSGFGSRFRVQGLGRYGISKNQWILFSRLPILRCPPVHGNFHTRGRQGVVK